VSKRFEPSTARQALIAVDVQTGEGPHWLLSYDEELLESLIVAAASLARRLLADGAACGIAVNGWTYSLAQTGFVPPRAGHEQLTRILDLLARTSPTASVPFGFLLAHLPTRIPSGTIVFALSGRDPSTALRALRRLGSSGFEARYVALGPAATAHVRQARRSGIDAIAGRLEPDWRTADVLALAG
jgi:uncharacterized protein (DUF58 family)